MIEIGEPTAFDMSYDDAVFYCFCLGDGWRLPTRHEYFTTDVELGMWYVDKQSEIRWRVTPVRDLKDD